MSLAGASATFKLLQQEALDLGCTERNVNMAMGEDELRRIIKRQTTKNFADLFKTLDKDGSGTISANEFKHAMTKSKKKDFYREAFSAAGLSWREVFNSADTNGDGFLDRRELEIFLGAAASQAGNVDAQLMERVDSDLERLNSELQDLKAQVEGRGPVVCFLGPPASGKGTQCKMLAESHGLFHIGVGDLTRDHIQRRTTFGRQVERYANGGQMVPTELLVPFLAEELKRNEVVQRGCLLDGFPRKVDQAAAMMGLVNVDLMVHFELPDEVCIERALSRVMDPETGAIYNMKTNPPPNNKAIRKRLQKRENDASEAVVRGRLAKYRPEVAGILPYFEGKVLTVNGTWSMARVNGVLTRKLAQLGCDPLPVGASPAVVAPPSGNSTASEQIDEDAWGAAEEVVEAAPLDIEVAPVKPMKGAGKCPVGIQIKIPEADTRAPADICCVIDISGSMRSLASFEEEGVMKNDGLTFLDIVKHAVKAVINMLEEGDRFSLVSFNSDASCEFKCTEMSASGKRVALAAVSRLEPRGRTNIWGGLQEGMDSIRVPDEGKDVGYRSKAVLLLTDGVPNEYPPKGHVHEMKAYKDKHPGFACQVNAFGFGYNLDSELLLQIATEGHGTYSFIPDALIVGTVFVNTVANVLSTFTQSAKVHVMAEEGAAIEGVCGDMMVDDAPWGKVINLGPLNYGTTRELCVQVDMPAGRGDYLEVVVEYPAANGESVRVPVTANARKPQKWASVAWGRSQMVEAGFGCVADFTSKSESAAQTKMAQCLSILQSKRLPQSETGCKNLVSDCQGRMSKALQGSERFNRWGKHFLRAITRAHQMQLCTNYMDAGLQAYGGPMFHQETERGGEVFRSLGAPVQSRAAQATPAPSRNTTRSAPTPAPAADTYYGGGGGG